MALSTDNGSNTINDLDKQIEKLWRFELISENEVRLLCDKAREIFISEGNVQRVDLPVTVNNNNNNLSSTHVHYTHIPLIDLWRHTRAVP